MITCLLRVSSVQLTQGIEDSKKFTFGHHSWGQNQPLLPSCWRLFLEHHGGFWRIGLILHLKGIQSLG